MALAQYTVTMTGSAVRAVATNLPIQYLRIENESGNALVNYGTSAVTTADYAGSVSANTATITNGVTVGPFSGEAPMNLDEFYFIGTNNQKIHLTVIIH